MKWELVFSILVLSMLSLPVGCGRPSESELGDGMIPPTPNGSEPGSTAALSGNRQANPADKKVSLPENFPLDVPIPPGAEPTANHKTDKLTTVTLETTDSLVEVIAYYQSALKASGWTIEASTATESGSVLGAVKQKRTLTIMAHRGEGNTVVKIDVGK
ncbi:MAG: hypothetical protein JW719_12225 [Pirellulales bacterium]|nr:hypothetical protein [Pirellulales bacterium]